MDILLGMIVIYTTIHFIVLSFIKNWNNRNVYEKVVSIAGITAIFLEYLAVIAG